MTWRTASRLELRRLRRSPGVWLAAIAFGAVLAAGVSLPRLATGTTDPDVGAAFLLGPAVDLVLPLLVIGLTYDAIAGHRERGTVHVFLAAPIDRTSLFAGLLVARIVILLGVTTIGLLAGVVGVVVLYGPPPIGRTAGFAALTLAATGAFACVGVGVSAALDRSGRALGVLVAGFVLAHAIWEPAVTATHAALTDAAAPDRWVDRLILLSPLEAYGTAANGILPPSPHLAVAVDGGDTSAETGAAVGGAIARGDLALAIGVLVGWALLLLVLARYRFQRADID